MSVMTVNVGNQKYGFNSFNCIHGEFVNNLMRKGDELITITESAEKKLKKTVDKVFKKYAIPSAVFTSIMTVSNKVFASGSLSLSERLSPLIAMVQELALPVGIVVASWGLIEIMIGNYEAGKSKLKYAVIGFIGMFIIPEVFYAIKDAFGTVNTPASTPSSPSVEELQKAKEQINTLLERAK